MDNRLLLVRQSSGKDTRYTYAVGRLRVLETRLLTGSFFDKMAEAATYEESLKMLSENPEYRQDVENLKEKSNFESIFISQLKRLYNLVSELTEDKEITNIFLLKYDIDNLKTLIKIKLLGGTKEAGFVDLGIFKIETLRDYIKNNNFKLPGEKIGDFIAKISEVRKPQRIEFLFDEFYLELLKEALAKIESPFLEYIYKTIIDLFNIKILIRLRSGLFERAFLGNGYIGKEFFYKQDTLNPKEFLGTAYYELVREVVESKIDMRRDKLLDNYLMNIIKEARYFHFGIEPLVGYIFAKEYEVKNLRRALTGKFFGVGEEEIKDSLEAAYV